MVTVSIIIHNYGQLEIIMVTVSIIIHNYGQLEIIISIFILNFSQLCK